MITENYWTKYISGLRLKEISILKEEFKENIFANGLELGAGNGFQSGFLAEFILRLTCTEFNESRLIQKIDKKINYKICDAEKIDEYFLEEKFDFIYSAHLLEHLPNPRKAISGIYKLLEPHGIAVHILPSSLNAITRIILWYPNLIISLIRKYLFFSNNHKTHKSEIKNTNNLKTIRNYDRSKFRKLILPRPHGVSNNVFIEIMAFSKERWIREFNNENFVIKKIIKGPFHSGYGIGFSVIRNLFDFMGLAGEYIYIMEKKVEKI